MRKVRYLILSGESSIPGFENQFVMECETYEEAKKEFDLCKKKEGMTVLTYTYIKHS